MEGLALSEGLTISFYMKERKMNYCGGFRASKSFAKASTNVPVYKYIFSSCNSVFKSHTHLHPRGSRCDTDTPALGVKQV